MNNFEKTYLNIILEETIGAFKRKGIKGEIEVKILSENDDIIKILNNIEEKINDASSSTLEVALQKIGSSIKDVAEKIKKVLNKKPETEFEAEIEEIE